MPVTARLSKLFYERFGEELADELVEWWNLLDTTYRSELRQHYELTYTRFEVRLEQRIAELRAELMQRFAEFELRVERRLVEFAASIEARLGERFEKHSERIDERMDRFEKRLDQQTRLLILAWATVLASVIGMGGLIITMPR